MFGKVTPERAIRFSIMCGRMTACLPPRANTGNFGVTCYKIYWWFCLCFSLLFGLPVVYDTYLNSNDASSILINTAELCPICTGTLKLLLCKYHREKLQACVSEVENYMRTVTLREQELLQSYVDGCIGFYYFMSFCIVVTIFGFSSAPVFSPQTYPTHSSYPFEVQTELLKNMLRAYQMTAVAQTGFLVASDFVFSAFVWLTAARFQFLSDEFRRVSDTEQLCICIQRHQVILRFADDVNLVTRFIAYGIGFSTAVGTVCGSIQFLRDISLMVKAQFVTFVAVGAFELLVYCWPAENLIRTSEAIGFSVYSSRWLAQSPEMTKLILTVIQRTKKPAVISIGTFVPMLSLNFYGSFLSTSFSYFTTLRATITTSGS